MLRYLVVPLVLFAGCLDTDGIKPVTTPFVEVDPPNFAFATVPLGETSTRTVTVFNAGAGTLKLRGLQTRLGPGVEAVSLPERANIESGDEVELVLRFKPVAADDTATGSIEYETNVLGVPTIEIPITGEQAQAELRVSPGNVDFGRVAVGDVAEAELVVSNTGTAPLKVGPPRINGDEGFAVSGADERPLVPGASQRMVVRYAARRDGPASAELVLESDDPQTPVYVVDLRANGASPCVSVTPAALEFPAALVGRSDTREVWVESCGGEPLTISALRLVDEGGHFELESDAPFRLPAMLPDQDLPGRAVPVSFSPQAEAVSRATLELHTDDPANPVLTVPVLGRGVLNACPIPHPGDRDRTVFVLDPVALDGSASSDPDGPNGRPVRYDWVLIEQPEGGVERIGEAPRDPNNAGAGVRGDDPTTPTAFLWPTLVGRYVAELRVTDALGVTAPGDGCGAADATVVIEAVASGEIHVQTTWDTPGDPDQTDAHGSDVDLHLRHEGGFWDAAPLDCYFGNTNPDWGPAGPVGDPSLDIDDVDGAGPENIKVSEPQVGGGPYRVGLHYFHDRGMGHSDVTVRVFFGGVLAGEFEERLDATNDFVEVTDIHWGPDGGRLEAVR